MLWPDQCKEENRINRPQTTEAPHRRLSLFDASCIIIGTIIGAGIFRLSPIVAANAGSVLVTVCIWMVGGVLALLGALCFAELTTRFSDQLGGDYVYLKMAYGKTTAFLFAWTAFWVIRPGNICVMALVFSEYLAVAIGGSWADEYYFWPALIVIMTLNGVNLLGIKPGTSAQNVLTVAKVTGIAGVIMLPVLTLLWGGDVVSAVDSAGAAPVDSVASTATEGGSFMLAIVFVMYTLSGWNDLAMVAGEIKQPEKNLHRALVLATVSVTLIYLAFNAALFLGLGYDGVASSSKVATDLVLQTAEGFGGTRLAVFLTEFGARMVATLVCVSCLGAINGMIITSPRIYYSVGLDFQAFRFLSQWNQQRGVPWQALLAQSAITFLLVLMTIGRRTGVEEMVTATTPFFFVFLGCTVFTLFIFRFRDARGQSQQTAANVQKVPFYPLPPILFLAVCGWMCYSSINYVVSKELTNLCFVLGGLMAVGVVVAIITKRTA